MRTYLIKYSLIALSIIALGSCSNDPWTRDQKSEFLTGCEEEGGTPGYCDCFMQGAMDMYPKYEDAKNMSFEEAIEISLECD